MDKLDFAIIRELSQSQATLPAKVGLKSSYRDMARKLHVSSGTIWNRIRSMYASGFLLGSSVYFNPSLLGLKGGAYAFDVPSLASKIQIIERLKLLDYVLFIHNFSGTLVGIFFVYYDEEEVQRRFKEIQALSGADDGIFSHVIYPPCKETLSSDDWAFISRLTEAEFSSYSQLARHFEISVRTVKRRMAKVLRAMTVLSSPTLNYRAIKNAVPADVIVVFTSPDVKSQAEGKIIRILGDFLIFAGVGEEFVVYNLILPSMHMVSDLVNSVKVIDGVKTVRAGLVDEHIDLTRNLHKIHQRQISQFGTA